MRSTHIHQQPLWITKFRVAFLEAASLLWSVNQLCYWLKCILWRRNTKLVEAFSSINIPIAALSPGPVQDLLSRFTVSDDRLMRPGTARKLIACSSTPASQLSASDAAQLLEYSLSEDVSVCLEDADVIGLMVPLLNGLSMPLTAASHGQALYLGDHADQQLFEGLSAHLVDTSGLTKHCVNRWAFCTEMQSSRALRV